MTTSNQLSLFSYYTICSGVVLSSDKQTIVASF